MSRLNLVLFFFLILSYSFAQTEIGGGDSYGIEVTYQQLEKKKRNKHGRNPLFYAGGSKTINFADKWAVGADLLLNKNTFEFDGEKSQLLETLQTHAPVYVNFIIDENWFLECGGYLGLLARSSNVAYTEFVDLSYLEHMQVLWDGGFVAGIGVNVKHLGKLKLRYNYGLKEIVPIDRDLLVKNRMVELGLVVVL